MAVVNVLTEGLLKPPLHKRFEPPSLHAVHPVVPVIRLLYVPAAHPTQAVEVAAVPASLYVPARHAVQADVPVVRSL